MEKKVISVLNYYEMLVVDIEYPFFHCCKWFTAITGHNKQMSVGLITSSTRM